MCHQLRNSGTTVAEPDVFSELLDVAQRLPRP